MSKKEYWFHKKENRFHPVAVHWKGHMLELLPVIFSAIWFATFVFRFFKLANISQALPFIAFAMFATAQGIKYYFYHEKTQSS